MKEFAKFISYILIGLAIITVACILIFDIFPAASGSKGYDAALAIAGTVMFWAVVGGVSIGICSLIKKLSRK